MGLFNDWGCDKYTSENLLAYDDDGCSGDNASASKITYTATSTAWATLYITAYYANTSGTYTLKYKYEDVITAPTVTTNSTATSTTSSSITCGGNLTSTGGASTTRGICYIQGNSGTPTISNTCVSAGSTTSTGTFSVTLSGLSSGTSYRCRAYATNSAGTSYGETYTFTTTSGPSNSTCGNATTLSCGSTLAGTTVGTPGNAHNISGASISNYGVWYTFIGDGNETTITVTDESYDVALEIASSDSPCSGIVHITEQDDPETYTFTTESGKYYYAYVAHYSSTGTTTGTFNISRTCVINHTVTLNSWPTSIGATFTGGGSYAAGSHTITATAPSGYQFVNWTDSGGNVVSHNASYTFTLSGDVTYQANFTKTTATSLPWTEGFESGYSNQMLLKGEWATPLRFGNLPNVCTYNTTSGSYSLEVRQSNGNYCMVVLPQFDQPLNTLVLSFNYKHGDHSSGYNVQLVAITDLNDPNTYTVVKQICSSSETISHYSNSSSPYTINLSECPNAPSTATPRLAIRYSETSSGGDSWYMDNFSVTASHTLTVQSNPTEGGSATAGSTTIVEGATTTITATPNTGYVFTGWTMSGTGAIVADASSPSTTFTMGTTNATVTANFEELGVFITSSPTYTECLTSGTEVVLTASTNAPMPAGNYSFEVASGSYSAISGTSSVSGDDSYSSAISLGNNFTFNYWGVDYTSVVIATNGYIKFEGSSSNGYSNDLTSSSYYNVLAAFWDDLDATSTQYTTTGTAPYRVFIMQHNGYVHGYSSNTFSFQIKLYETTNVIEFCYGDGFPNVTSCSASIGLNNRENGVTSFISVTPTGVGTATTSTSSANNNIGTTQCDYLTLGTIYRFTPPTPIYTWTANGTQGTANGDTYTVSPTQNSTYTVSATISGQTYTKTASVTVTPAAPTGFTVSNITSTTATVTWNANGASSWQYSINNGSTWTNVNTYTVNLTGLTPGQSYPFQVKAVSGSCESSVGSCTVTTLNTFTLTYNSNGGSGTMTDPDSPYNYGSTVTVLANSFTRTGYVFNCWNTAADGSGTKYVADDTFTITANTTLYAQWVPLVIANTTQWDEFAAAVNSGFTYNGLTVTMTADVGTVTRMVGTSSNVFRGTFNGQCRTLDVNITSEAEFCGPFCYTYGATIENLKVTGTINTSHKHTGGVVGRTGTGKLTLTNVLSSVTINSSISGSGEQGGLVGYAINGEFKGCAFTGKLLGGNTTQSGGLLGWKSDTNNSDVAITDCLFSPTEITMSTSGGHTLAHGTVSKVTITNSYYTTQFGTAQGKQAYTLDMVASPTAGGTVSHTDSGTEYGCSGITAYATGLAYDIDNDAADELLLGDGESATITASANSGYTFMNWTDGSSTPTVNPYAVTMGAANRNVTANFINQTTSTDWTTAVDAIGDVPSGGITISSGNVTIGNREGLAWVISMVNALNGVTAEDAETFAGLTYTLTADVDMSAHTWVPIGTTEHPFSGTFNGNGHVIKGITRSTDFPHDGLFGYVSGSANIQNVVVQANLTGNSHATGAVVGTFASTGTISNVEGAGTLTGGALTTALGGIAGNNTGGTIHSSFGVATMTGGASATQMGGLVGNNTGNLYNSYSNATYSGTSATKGGLVGANSGTVENCYAAGIASGVSAFAGSNSSSGTIQNCYTNVVGSGYIGTNNTAPTGSGTYGAVQSSIKHLDYMYRDNLIAANTNTYVGGSGVTSYVGNHIPVWNGLVSALNQWVRSNPRSLTGLAPWYRPISSHINGDLPVLGFAMDNSLGTLDSDGKFLQYGSNQNGGNGLDAVLTTFNNSTASIFHYGKATGVANVPTANVKVSVAEDAVLLQGNGASPFTATVGVTFDNSDHGQHAYDFWGNKLNYDWHLLSTPLSNLKTGAVHSTYQASGDPHSAVDITSIGGYFPANLITPGNPAIGGAIKWDFYTYYEPEYHWINLKRNKNNHYHQDSPNGLITYSEADQDVNGTSAIYIPGKGYEMAISQDTYMNASGTLNRGNVSITLTNQEPNDINYAKGWNLVGNPYQAYLNIDEIGYDPIYTYDADQGLYVPYTKTASANPAIVSQYIHPHQAFFVRTATDNATLTFEQSSMATTSSAPESYFRDKVNYPLVNLFAEDETGHRDLTVVEFHRPELGGAAKLDYMRTAPFSLAAHYSGKSYGILFATDDIERVPVHFKPAADGLITLSWSTHNGEFSLLKLVDNKLGVEHNMLADNSYSFMASADDYSSRFYITYECSGMGIDENDEGGASTGSATFAYINNGNIVVDVGAGHGASLQVIDVLGRVLYSQEGLEGACTVSTSGLAKGVYILRLSSNQGIKTQKIVVQ